MSSRPDGALIAAPKRAEDRRAAQAGIALARDAILSVLRDVDGNKEKAAEVLGLSATTLWRKMKRLNVSS